ncbi:MAG: hypothetical protein WC707_05495 [Candidatus Babeliaceae bacterium]|jgi:hypothetical protein
MCTKNFDNDRQEKVNRHLHKDIMLLKEQLEELAEIMSEFHSCECAEEHEHEEDEDEDIECCEYFDK